MSSEYLSDREQEEALRNWWKENWGWVAGGIAIGFLLLGAWNYWQRREESQKAEASQAFRELTLALAANNKEKVEAITKNLDENFSGSPYADQAHLLLAQSHVNGDRFELAATELQHVVDKSKDTALVQIAKLRLARVQIQLGHYDEALALLDVSKAGAFGAQVNEVRGDALLAKGDANGAREAYQAALAASQTNGARSSDNDFLQLKLQDLAAASPEPQTPASPTSEK
ncbi:MAG TPA: tetratricopeptide repeat protein [Steroidobacteraceae bacterium]|nr:tetratricopeptide repeat protein [Steroidobacteraceae bacterium]